MCCPIYSAVPLKHRFGYKTVMLWLPILFYYDIFQRNYRKMVIFLSFLCKIVLNYNTVHSYKLQSKGYTYMPYLTLRDKISKNLALLKADSHKIFKSHGIFRPSKYTFYKEIIINHTLSQVSYIKIKAF